MRMPKSMAAWLAEHAESRQGQFFCKKTGESILGEVVGRSIWVRPFCGGTGEVEQVLHVACLACDPKAEPPRYGLPIYSDELVKTDVKQIA